MVDIATRSRGIKQHVANKERLGMVEKQPSVLDFPRVYDGATLLFLGEGLKGDEGHECP